MNPFMWIVWGVVALLFLLVTLVVLAGLLALVTPASAIVVALFEDTREWWRARLASHRSRRARRRSPDPWAAYDATSWVDEAAELDPALLPDWQVRTSVDFLAAMPEPSPFCAQHQPLGSGEPCAPCGVARKRHDLWSQAIDAKASDDLTARIRADLFLAAPPVPRPSDDMAVVDATTDHGRAL